MTNKYSVMSALLLTMFATSACESSSPEATEKFVEKSTMSGTKSESGTIGDVGNSALTFLPSIKDFGDVPIGEISPAQVITLFNSSEYPIYLGKLEVTNTTSYSIAKTDCPFEDSEPVDSGVSCRVYVQFTPVIGGMVRGKIKLTYGLKFEANSQFSSGADVSGSGVSNLLFSGVGSLTELRGNSVTVNWTHVVGANSYFIYLVDDDGAATLKGSVVAPSQSFTISGLTKNTAYKVRVNALDSQGVSDGNTNDVVFTTLANNAPTITSISPKAGPITGGQTITITGLDYATGAGVKIGDIACATTTFVSQTKLTCVTAAGSGGTYALTVTNADGQTTTLPSAYTYQGAPSITSVLPVSGSWHGGTTITITGNSFVAGASVSVGGTVCNSVVVVNPTTLTCITSAYAGGATGGKTVSVTVTNADAQAGTLALGYTYTITQMDLLAGSIEPRGCRVSTNPDDVRFDTIRGMATDGTYLYVAVYASHVIYKIDLATRATTVFAGQPCIQGTVDGPASAALVNSPQSLAIIGDYLYFSNYASHQIRKVDLASGDVSTVAGSGVAGNANGVGVAAQFNGIWELTTDGTYLYSTDNANHRIRRIDVSSGTVTTFAGSAAGDVDAIGAAAQFNAPAGITYENGYLYVSETGNDKIRRINVNTAAVTTFAGSVAGHSNGIGTIARFNNPRGLTSDGTHLYVADLQMFRRIEIDTAYVSVLSGVYNVAEIVDGPVAVARTRSTNNVLVHNGYIYFGDDANVIRRVNTTTGEMSTWVGLQQNPWYANGINDVGSAARFNGLRANTYHEGYIYAADYSNHVIRRIDPVTGAVTTFTGMFGQAGAADGVAGSARHNAPVGIAAYGDYLYVGEYTARTVRRIHIPTQSVETFAGAYNVSGTDDAAVGTDARFVNVAGVAVNSDGSYLYVADQQGHRVRRIDLSTTEVTTLAGSIAGTVDGVGVNARFNQPRYLHASGNTVYVTSAGDHRIRMINATTKAVVSLNGGTAGYLDSATAWNSRFSLPTEMTSDDTYLYVVEYNNHSIRKIDKITLAVSTVTANLQPNAQATTSNKPMWCNTGELSGDAAISWPYGISYNSSLGLIVTNDYGIYLFH